MFVSMLLFRTEAYAQETSSVRGSAAMEGAHAASSNQLAVFFFGAAAIGTVFGYIIYLATTDPALFSHSHGHCHCHCH